MLNDNTLPKFGFHHGGIHVATVGLFGVAIPEGILRGKFLRLLFHLKIIGRQRGQVIHLISTVDI